MCFFPGQDQNFGLVQRVIKSVVHARIQRLTKVYMTLSLEEVAKQAGLASTQDVVQELLYMVRFAEILSIYVPVPFILLLLLFFWFCRLRPAKSMLPSTWPKVWWSLR